VAIVVQKYGGSSVATTERIQKVAARVVALRETGTQVVVVVSAMGSTTDELMARAKEIAAAPSRRELDMLLTCGERASMALLSMAIHELGHEAISLTGSQSGIITSARHSGARILEVRPYRVWDELDDGKIVIVAGFQGVSYKREITTLGRGGSDTTAVALAGALSAEYCEICSDVDGVYSADPRVVPAAALLHAISHDEMLELASHGAKVLHPESVEFARKTGIALWARGAQSETAGTRVDRPDTFLREHTVTGVAALRGLVRLRASGADAMDRMLGVAAEGELPVLHLDADHEAADLWFSLSDVPDWPALKTRIAQEVVVEEGWGAVSVVGDFVGRNAAKLAKTRAVAQEAGTTVLAMATSPLRVTLLCKDAEVADLTAALHAAFRE